MTTEPNKRSMRADALRNRELVLAAARSVFAEKGLAGGFEEIAKRAGVGVGTVYRRFPDKESLAEVLFELRLCELADIATLALEQDDSWVALADFVTTTVEMQVADRGLRDVLLGTEYTHSKLSSAKARVIVAVDNLIRRARENGRLRSDIDGPDIAVIGGMLSQLSTPESPQLWRRYLALILDGMRRDDDAATSLPVPSPTEETVGLLAAGVRTTKP